MDSRTVKKLVVMGAPIAHSQSPRIFAEFFKQYGVCNATYYQLYADGTTPIRLLFDTLGLYGANVTSPLKNVAFASVDEASDTAKNLGAVNTIVNRDGRLHGYNTDPDGVRGALQELGINPTHRHCYVLGAGGAAAAVVYTLVKLFAKPIIINRTFDHALRLSHKLGIATVPMEYAKPKHGDLLFSCLPPRSTLPQWNWDVFDWVFDSVYSSSPMEQISASHPLPRIGAKEWLYHQALAAFKVFFDGK